MAEKTEGKHTPGKVQSFSDRSVGVGTRNEKRKVK